MQEVLKRKPYFRSGQEPEIMNRPEAAKFMRISTRLLDYEVRAGKINSLQVGKKGIRFHKDDIMEYLRTNK